ncbi:argininosuccinate synthase domain-containing protein [Cytobacillus oceanisediminis]|uniref:argininosuccinate synthase domain-containing protein n=1 Tax=Cytobacillus oceanisediminis TaxID=665099 RepID=UPI001C2253D5|nr:argininosuccinate synthase domain-containing protein [Cytobacillus oceanisediminis]MBU8772103.1 argininosuccinate synthase [Cytobacillus oceanisediminis]
MGKILQDSRELTKYKGQKVILLYSGGLDSMYAAYTLNKMGIKTFALTVDVGQKIPNDIEKNSKKLGIELRIIDVQSILCSEYLSYGIRFNALYNNNYPISSSYTRPLIAKEAVKLAEKINSQLIVHSATPMQNSASRFNLSILSLSQTIDIYCPAILDYTEREKKISVLNSIGIEIPEDNLSYSIDENLWARVIESGTLETPELELHEDSLYEWTKNLNDSNEQPLEITISFKDGLPFKLNGIEMSLSDIIKTLNGQLGKLKVGRYSGFEENLFGTKSHEVREAPAAHLIHESHKLLEEMILSTNELKVKHFLDREWTDTVVKGGWFSKLKESLDSIAPSFSKDIVGDLKWKIDKGMCSCISINSPKGMYSAKYPDFVEEFRPFTLNSIYQQARRTHRQS